jgi:hypothetical protein
VYGYGVCAKNWQLAAADSAHIEDRAAGGPEGLRRPGNLTHLCHGANHFAAMVTGDGSHTETIMRWCPCKDHVAHVLDFALLAALAARMETTTDA